MFDHSQMKKKAGETEYSNFDWTDEAKARVERVPEGFMRNMTIKRVEGYAEKLGTKAITLDIAEKSLTESSSMMGSMMETQQNSAPTIKTTEPKKSTVSFFSCFLCGFALKGYAPIECPICQSMEEKFVEIEETQLSKASCRVLKWDADSLLWLNDIPDGFMRGMGRWRIEKFCRSTGLTTVSMKEVLQKTGSWEKGSQKVSTEMPWDEDALIKIQRIPEFVRGTILSEVEKSAKAKGIERITIQELILVKNKWEQGNQFHSR